MKKILILSYFFPPSLFVGGQRTAFWAKELHRFGYYPIIVTRNWNEGQTTLTEPLHSNELKIERFETHEIHYLPYKRSLRDKIAGKLGLKYIQKALTLWELIFSNYSISALPYGNMFKYCDQLIKTEDIPVFTASGRPFQSFFIGHKLRKKHDILWIPDYRDEWNSHYRSETTGGAQKFIQKLEQKSEVRWLSNADHFISVSQLWVDRISSLTGKNGFVVKNGFDTIYEKAKRNDKNVKVLYAGTLYPYQDISMVLNSITSLNNPRIQFYFIGTCESPDFKVKLDDLAKEYPEIVHIKDKVPKVEFEKIIAEMDIGILSSYVLTDGWLPVKIYDYYAHGLELLLCPSDEDLMVKFIEETQSGNAVNSQEECEAYLLSQLEIKQSGKELSTRNYELGKEYHRSYQTRVFANTLDALLKK